MWEKRNAYGVQVRKPKGCRLLGRPGHKERIILKLFLEGCHRRA
jgi:hypothetical protein